MNRRLALLIAWHLCLLPAARCGAHPVSVTRNHTYVTREQVTAKIEVLAEDLYLFHKLKPNEQDFLEPDVIRAGIERHEKFLLDKFDIRDVAGRRLEGRVVGVKPFDMDERGVPLAELMAHTTEFELQYELPSPPEFLTFSQHFTDETVTLPSEMTLVLKQENSAAAEKFVLRPNEPNTVRFSWDNPPLSPEASRDEQQQWLARQKQETLGITSYSSVYSFLYIDDHEVRHEILIPILTLESSVLIARDDDDFLDIAEQDAARQQIEAFFTTGNPIEIDGAPVKPTVQRCDFYGLDFKDFARQAERRPVSITNARVGIILSYPTVRAPDTVRLTWNRFNNYVWAVNMVVYAYDETSRVTLSRLGKNNTFYWQNPGRPPRPTLEEVAVTLPPRPQWSVPVATVCCLLMIPAMAVVMRIAGAATRGWIATSALLLVGAAVAWPYAQWKMPDPFAAPPALSDSEAQSIFAALQQNTYRAFDYRTEDEVYDALAKSVDGELLNELYLQIHQGLEMQEQGGAVSRVREVTLLEGRKQPLTDGKATAGDSDERGFQFRCRWNVNGTVEHWGHIHSRTNQYEAVFSIEPRNGAWKITRVELLDQKRVNFETSLRGL